MPCHAMSCSTTGIGTKEMRLKSFSPQVRGLRASRCAFSRTVKALAMPWLENCFDYPGRALHHQRGKNYPIYFGFRSPKQLKGHTSISHYRELPSCPDKSRTQPVGLLQHWNKAFPGYGKEEIELFGCERVLSIETCMSTES